MKLRRVVTYAFIICAAVAGVWALTRVGAPRAGVLRIVLCGSDGRIVGEVRCPFVKETQWHEAYVTVNRTALEHAILAGGNRLAQPELRTAYGITGRGDAAAGVLQAKTWGELQRALSLDPAHMLGGRCRVIQTQVGTRIYRECESDPFFVDCNPLSDRWVYVLADEIFFEVRAVLLPPGHSCRPVRTMVPEKGPNVESGDKRP